MRVRLQLAGAGGTLIWALAAMRCCMRCGCGVMSHLCPHCRGLQCGLLPLAWDSAATGTYILTAGVAHLSSLYRLTSLNLWNCLRVTGELELQMADADTRKQPQLGRYTCGHSKDDAVSFGACWHRPPCLLLATTCRSQHLAPPAAPHAENGLSVLRHFPLLEDLSLRGCQQLQDGCLAHLAGLTRLARLDMRACEHLRGVVSQGQSARQTCRCVVAAAATRCAVVWMAGWGRSA